MRNPNSNVITIIALFGKWNRSLPGRCTTTSEHLFSHYSFIYLSYNKYILLIYYVQDTKVQKFEI